MRALAPVGILLLLIAGCSSARRGEPLEGPFASSDASIQRGEVVFAEHCHKCHPGGEAGLGPALNNKPLPVFLMKFQVRHGLGVMPSFSERQISDDELEDLMEFVVAYRRHG